MCQIGRRIGCVIPHRKLQRGITQPILRYLYRVAAQVLNLIEPKTSAAHKNLSERGPQQSHATPARRFEPCRASISHSRPQKLGTSSPPPASVGLGGWRRWHEYFIPVVANHLGPFESLTAAPRRLLQLQEGRAERREGERGMALIVHRLIGFRK